MKSPLEITKAEDQLNDLKSEMSHNKGWDAKLEDVIHIASAAYKDRARSLDIKSKPGFKHTPTTQSPSQWGIKAFKDGNKTMKDVS